MTENQRERRGPWLGCLLAGLLIGLPAYVLSVGPMAAAMSHLGFHSYAVDAFYQPLQMLYQIWPPARHFLDWYIDLWQ